MAHQHANDFQGKQPTKNEKMFYEIAMQLHDLDYRVWSISSHMLAMGMLLNIDPKKMAEYLTGDENKIKEYAQKINEEIEKIRAAKKPEEGAQPPTEEK